MKKLLIITLLTTPFLLTGCYDHGMTNEEIIAETKKCEEAGMDTFQLVDGWTYKVKDVICKPNNN